jgi:hypothetical protein
LAGADVVGVPAGTGCVDDVVDAAGAAVGTAVVLGAGEIVDAGRDGVDVGADVRPVVVLVEADKAPPHAATPATRRRRPTRRSLRNEAGRPGPTIAPDDLTIVTSYYVWLLGVCEQARRHLLRLFLVRTFRLVRPHRATPEKSPLSRRRRR